MKKILLLLVTFFALVNVLYAQQSTVTGRVTDALDNTPIRGVTVSIKGVSGKAVQTGNNGQYTIEVPTGSTLVFYFVGMKRVERAVNATGQINVSMESSSESLSDVVVTGALGIKEERRSMGSSVQTVSAAEVAGTQRENFINALQGRVAGLDIISTSGVPGASSSILLRGVSSISGDNSPLIIIDGLPSDNSTMATSDFGGSGTSGVSFENRGIDFTNRSADFNPEDIESITVLKGPEAAALYGIAAANGAIVITTKRGKIGDARVNYNNSLRVDRISKAPEVQNIWDLGRNGVLAITNPPTFFGPEFLEEQKLYDNVGNFFNTALTHKHNLSFEGGVDKTSWRLSAAYVDQDGVVPNSNYSRLNLTAATRSQVKDWLGIDVAMNYSTSDNSQPFKGAGGPLIGVLLWPANDDASNYLNPDGSRRRYFSSTSSTEVDNPFFSVNKNKNNSKVNRIYATTGLTITPVNWLTYDLKVGFDVASTASQVLRHPESNLGIVRGGILDEARRINKSINIQGFFTAKKTFGKISANGMIGHSLQNNNGNSLAVTSEKFLDPNFISINNSTMESRYSRSTISDYRIVGLYGRAMFDYDRIVYLTVTGRNDWTSTLPVKNNSFFYPSASLALNFTDIPAFHGIKSVMNYGKLRASIAQVGKDARPYKIYPGLIYKDTAFGGYGYDFNGPNLNLRPEMATSWEVGAEMAFLNDRINVDVAYYKKKTKDQIVNDIRQSYSTGFILIDMNGGDTQNSGVELMLSGKPIMTPNFTWRTSFNFARSRAILLSLPRDLPETYNSDTWFYGNVRNGAIPGKSVMSLTGYFYERNDSGELLITPSTGLPIRETDFVYNGTDRWPKWTLGWSNSFSYKAFDLNFLIDTRYGGDVLNATEHYLTAKGKSKLTLDRMEPRVVKGVLKDGLENTDNPTQNNLVIIPQYQNAYYINMSEEYFIEKHINWLRLKDVTLSYTLPKSIMDRQKAFRSASAFITATDVFLITNYSGSDPIVNGNNAAVGGSGGIGIDYGNFAIPVGFNVGIRFGL